MCIYVRWVCVYVYVCMHLCKCMYVCTLACVYMQTCMYTMPCTHSFSLCVCTHTQSETRILYEHSWKKAKRCASRSCGVYSFTRRTRAHSRTNRTRCSPNCLYHSLRESCFLSRVYTGSFRSTCTTTNARNTES